ncbi:MAG TPA: NAD(P)H-binding protein, partial [Thermoanaerobaculia bacterium]
MKVLVTGGTGFVGTHLVNTLLRRGHAVAVLSRHADEGRNRYNHPVRSIPGDVLDPLSLAAAVSGFDAVIHLVGIIHEQGSQTFDRVHREAVENVLAAMASARVRRLVHMSAMGSSADSPSEYGRTKAAGEAAVRQSGLDWTVV